MEKILLDINEYLRGKRQAITCIAVSDGQNYILAFTDLFAPGSFYLEKLASIPMAEIQDLAQLKSWADDSLDHPQL